MELEQAIKQLENPRNPYDPDITALRVAVLHLFKQSQKAPKSASKESEAEPKPKTAKKTK